ncbi:MAG: acyl-CoA dehydrogenase family protein, partial [Mycobacterium sp.]|nr:acyl-CoA dehydrogenase family protein [Mycobacterium sp.]
MYGLTAEDLRIRDTAREFVETLIPYEAEAEEAGGQLPKEITAEHHARAIELGLYATNMP